MKVNMLTATYHKGERLKPNDMREVDDRTGDRWVQAGIAEKLVSKSTKKTDTTEEE